MNRETTELCWIAVLACLLYCGIDWPWFIDITIWSALIFILIDHLLGIK